MKTVLSQDQKVWQEVTHQLHLHTKAHLYSILTHPFPLYYTIAMSMSEVCDILKSHLKNKQTLRWKERIKLVCKSKDRELGLKLTLLVGCWLKRWGSSSMILIKDICLLSVIQLRSTRYHLQLFCDRH